MSLGGVLVDLRKREGGRGEDNLQSSSALRSSILSKHLLRIAEKAETVGEKRSLFSVCLLSPSL